MGNKIKELLERLFWGVLAVIIVPGTWFLVVAIWPDVAWWGLFPSFFVGIAIWAAIFTLVEKKRNKEE